MLHADPLYLAALAADRRRALERASHVHAARDAIASQSRKRAVVRPRRRVLVSRVLLLVGRG